GWRGGHSRHSGSGTHSSRPGFQYVSGSRRRHAGDRSQHAVSQAEALRIMRIALMTLRQRILFALLPLVCLLALIGAIGILLLHRVGEHIKGILRENYV